MRRPLRETLRDIDKTPPKCLAKTRRLDEPACKPDSVTPCGAGDHPSETTVSGGLPRTLTRPACDLPGSSGGPPSIASADARGRPLGLAPGGVCRATTVTGRAVVSYTRHFTLTQTLSPDGAGFRAVCFLWHFPAGHPGWALPTTLSFGVRTFLDAVAPRSPGRLVQLVILRQESLGSAWHVLPLEQVSRDKPTQLHGGLFHELP